jgi:hypothetical protein
LPHPKLRAKTHEDIVLLRSSRGSGKPYQQAQAMTPTTPSKSPVDTIRDVLEYYANPIGYVEKRLKDGERINGQHMAAVDSALEPFKHKAAEALSALSSLSTQPAQTTDQLLIDMLMDLSKKVANVNGIGGTRDWLVAELGVIISHAQDGVAPAPSQTEGLEASVWIATIVYPNGDESHRYAATREAAVQLGHESTRVSGTVVSVLPAFALSLPRQTPTVEQVTEAVWRWAIDARMVNAQTSTFYLMKDLRSRIETVLPPSDAVKSLPRQKGEVDMETVIDIRAAIIELMGTGVKVPTTEDLIAYMATSPK